MNILFDVSSYKRVLFAEVEYEYWVGWSAPFWVADSDGDTLQFDIDDGGRVCAVEAYVRIFLKRVRTVKNVAATIAETVNIVRIKFAVLLGLFSGGYHIVPLMFED